MGFQHGVIPDNRRPVDYEHRVRMLAEVRREVEEGERLGMIEKMLSSMADGRIKLFMNAVVLRLRRDEPDLFLKGAYMPL